jgi:hypothetical protein
MMLLPASEYVPPGIYRLMYPPERGLDGLPTHGLLLEISNSGVVGLVSWLVQVVLCYLALRRLGKQRVDPQAATHWRFGRDIFLIGTVFYMIQVSLTSPIWSVILGIGWAAVAIVARQRQLARIQPAPTAPPANQYPLIA